MTVYVTNTGEEYHLDGCKYLSKSKIAMPLSQARISHAVLAVQAAVAAYQQGIIRAG